MKELCPHCGAKQPAVRVAFCPVCRGDVDEPPVDSKMGQPVRETVDLTIWYATETEFLNGFRESKHVAQGVFVAVAEGLQFVGHRRSGFEMRRIRAVKWMVPWPALVGLAVYNAFLLLLLFVIVALAGSETAGCGAIIFFTLGVFNIAIFSSPALSWIRVDFLDERYQPYRAYFTIGSVAERWTGGGRRLYTLFRQLAEQGEIVIPPVERADPDTQNDKPPDTGFFTS